MKRRYGRRDIIKLVGGATLAGAAVAVGGRPTTSTATTATPTASPVADAGDQLLLRIEYVGGFVPVEFIFTSAPMVSVYADGRVITTGPMIEIYPQPALPNLRQLVLTESGLERVMDEVRNTGLFAESTHYDGPQVTDMPDTVFTFTDNGTTVVVSAYALGLDESMVSDRGDADARAKLLQLQSFMFDLQNQLGAEAIAAADEPYQIERIKVLARVMDPANPPWDDPSLAQMPVAWPLDTPLAEIAAPYEGPLVGTDSLCLAIEGDDAAALVTALKSASQLTPFESDGDWYQLWPRPLLPDEPTACD